MTSPRLSGFSDEVAAYIAAATQPRRERSVAVFDFDNTCILGDIGELFGCYLIDEMAYRYDLDEFWELIAPDDGRDELRAMVDELKLLGDDARESELYESYRAEMSAVYPRRLAREGKRTVYEWAVRLHVGLSQAEIHTMSWACAKAEWQRPVQTESFATDRGESIEVRRGLRRFRAIREVMAHLEEQGHEVYVVSATNDWTVKAAAAWIFGLHPNRVRGNRVSVDDGVLTADTVPPVLYREGKVEVIEREIRVRPTIVFGDSDTDLDMMTWAEHAVLIDHGNAEARVKAAQEQWAVQPQAQLELEDAP